MRSATQVAQARRIGRGVSANFGRQGCRFFCVQFGCYFGSVSAKSRNDLSIYSLKNLARIYRTNTRKQN